MQSLPKKLYGIVSLFLNLLAVAKVGYFLIMQNNHEKHCGGSLAAGGAKPPLSLSTCMERLPHVPRWQHAHITSVWSFSVAELYDACHQSPCVFMVMGTFHLVKPFLLDDTVHALRYGIVRRLVFLGHADCGIDSMQMFYILVTAIF